MRNGRSSACPIQRIRIFKRVEIVCVYYCNSPIEAISKVDNPLAKESLPGLRLGSGLLELQRITSGCHVCTLMEWQNDCIAMHIPRRCL